MSLCQQCNQPATIHITEITSGTKNDFHLCQACATQRGYVQKTDVKIQDLLKQFLKSHGIDPPPDKPPGPAT